MSNTFPNSLPAHTCPRCLGGIPSNTHRGQYAGALSRTDNKTQICSACGLLEALEQVSGIRPCPQSDWRANTGR